MMKSGLLLRITMIVLLIAVVAGACTSLAAPAGQKSPTPKMIAALDLPRPFSERPVCTFAWDAPALAAATASVPTQVMVFEVVKQTPTKDVACQVAAQLGAPVSRAQYATLPQDGPTPDLYILGSGDCLVTALTAGNFAAMWGSRQPTLGAGKAKEALSVEETKAAADAFLADTGLLPEGAAFAEVVPALSGIITDPATGEDQEHVFTRAAVYTRTREGRPEGRFSVEVNGDGMVCGVLRNMRDLVPLGEYPLTPLAQTAALLETPAARILGLSDTDGHHDAVITSAKVQYFDGAAGYNMDTIQPMYVFEGTAVDSSGKVKPFVAQLPAVRADYTAAPGTMKAAGAGAKFAATPAKAK